MALVPLRWGSHPWRSAGPDFLGSLLKGAGARADGGRGILPGVAMALGAAVAVAIFAVVSLLVGFRLLRVAHATGDALELVAGLTFLLSGAAGHALFAVAHRMSDELPRTAQAMTATALVSVTAGAIAVWVVVWLVFRPRSPWAAALVVTATAATICSVAVRGLTTGFAPGPYGGVWFWIGFLSRAGAYGWACVEASLTLRRSIVQRGAGDPLQDLERARYLFFATGSGAAVLIFAVITLDRLGWVSLGPASSLVVQSVLGLAAAASMWLAFVPARGIPAADLLLPRRSPRTG